MTDPSVTSERFGDALGQALGQGPGRNTLAVQRAEILELLAAGGKPQKRQLGRAFAFALAGALAVGCLLVLGLHRSDLEAHVGDLRIEEHRELVADTAPKLVSFSDGSEVSLQSAARASVSHMSRERADLQLTRGKLVASIRKSTGVTWTISVGPYSVRVVGTRFSVDWEPTSKTLRVDVSEGRVRVSGGDLPSGGIALDGGSHLERHYGAEAQHEAVNLDRDRAEADPSGASAAAAPAPVSAPAGRAEPVVASTPASNTAPPFLALAAKGKYRDALEQAERQGFSQLAATLPENDLVVLANAARFSGNAERAREALLKLRQRFRGRPGAELGALYLARVAEDLDKRPHEAAQWLRAFLQESPAGDLAAGARANLMTLLLGMGDRAGARGVAEDYLRYHPGGPHIQKARAVLAEANARE